ncbi:aspartyl-phosphate phosphatase Spo0E family protein [Bacillus sp. Bva_UNVM-123]|uniref:aspartyl-phosphate phosphatase Spo0E family protein n=1 Tax=Bacillus sp. Bva_UNVM-123 TaxID=2829798 RepID=UPI00391EE791
MNKTLLEQLVLRRINKMRKEMILTARKTGLNSNETLNTSKRLDKLIYFHLQYFS